MLRVSLCAVLVMLALVLTSCGGKASNKKQCFPVKGVLYVDGKPASNVRITMHNTYGMDAESPTVSQGFSNENGEFVISTYEQGDGAPTGQYTLTFFWGELNLFTMEYGGKDKLNDRYGSPEKSTVKVQIIPGDENDLGKVELKTK